MSLFSRFQPLYKEEFHLCAGDTVIVEEKGTLPDGTVAYRKEHFKHVSAQAETIRVRIDSKPE